MRAPHPWVGHPNLQKKRWYDFLSPLLFPFVFLGALMTLAGSQFQLKTGLRSSRRSKIATRVRRGLPSVWSPLNLPEVVNNGGWRYSTVVVNGSQLDFTYRRESVLSTNGGKHIPISNPLNTVGFEVDITITSADVAAFATTFRLGLGDQPQGLIAGQSWPDTTRRPIIAIDFKTDSGTGGLTDAQLPAVRAIVFPDGAGSAVTATPYVSFGEGVALPRRRTVRAEIRSGQLKLDIDGVEKATSSTISGTVTLSALDTFLLPAVQSTASDEGSNVRPVVGTIHGVKIPVLVSSTYFNYTGAAQTYTVPEGVTALQVDAYGAQGSAINGVGGKGGRVQAVLPVTPGEVLQVNVGGAGSAVGSGAVGPSVGGWNGGGDVEQIGGARYGSGGGGATDIRRGANALADRILVAGGGGGAPSSDNAANGGDGGGLIGGTGGSSTGIASARGTGGTQSAGGTAGTSGGSGRAGQAGSLGQGGFAGGTSWGQAGGGGGGYYGGGGGSGYNTQANGGGGGGGSSYTDPTATGVVHTKAVRTGNGLVTLTPT